MDWCKFLKFGEDNVRHWGERSGLKEFVLDRRPRMGSTARRIKNSGERVSTVKNLFQAGSAIICGGFSPFANNLAT